MNHGLKGIVSRSVMSGFLVFTTGFSQTTSAATPVMVQSLEQGQGTLRARNGECFAITPQHVVGLGLELSITSTDRTMVPAKAFTQLGDDIAVIRIEAQGRIPCEGHWPKNKSLTQRLNSAITEGSEGIILRVRETGGLETIPVRFRAVDDKYVDVTSSDPSQIAFRGISGSQLLLEGDMMGMILTIEGNTIRAYRKDSLDNLTGDFFRNVHARASIGAAPIESHHEHVLVTKNTAIYEKPTSLSNIIRKLRIGYSMEITGKVVGRPWLKTQEGFIRQGATSPL